MQTHTHTHTYNTDGPSAAQMCFGHIFLCVLCMYVCARVIDYSSYSLPGASTIQQASLLPPFHLLPFFFVQSLYTHGFIPKEEMLGIIKER